MRQTTVILPCYQQAALPFLDLLTLVSFRTVTSTKNTYSSNLETFPPATTVDPPIQLTLRRVNSLERENPPKLSNYNQLRFLSFSFWLHTALTSSLLIMMFIMFWRALQLSCNALPSHGPYTLSL